MTDISDTDDEYNGGNGSDSHDAPDSPRKATTGIGDTEQSDSDTALDDNSGGSIKELGHEEELLVMVSLTVPDFPSKRARVCTLIPCILSEASRTAESWPDP